MSPENSFAALGDATRLELLNRLSFRYDDTTWDDLPTIKELTRGLKQSRQGISKHLNIMERAGLITSRMQGRKKHYAIEKQSIQYMRDYLSSVSKQWDSVLSRLDHYLAED